MAVRVITKEYRARFSYQHFHSSLHEILAFKKFLREVFQKNTFWSKKSRSAKIQAQKKFEVHKNFGSKNLDSKSRNQSLRFDRVGVRVVKTQLCVINHPTRV